MSGRIRALKTTTALRIFVLYVAHLLLLTCPFRTTRCNAFVPKNPQATRTRSRHALASVDLNLFGPRKKGKEQSSAHVGSSLGQVTVNAHKVNGLAAVNSKNIPFVIERLSMFPRDQVFKEIAELCISVFFNDGKIGRALPPWKEVQLSYLRTIQMADLRRRRSRDKNTNAMFVAYRVEEALPNAARSQPLILDRRDVYNSHAFPATDTSMTDYVRTEMLGFCEVSMVPFGLAPNSIRGPELDSEYVYDNDDEYDDNYKDDNSSIARFVSKRARKSDVIARPVLTNLSVKIGARASGVGSKLLEACERTAASEWGKHEMVLEVEDDNQAARRWYQKRGYRVLFSDPSCRRYDVNGLFLKKVPCTRQVMRKQLKRRSPTLVGNASEESKLSFENLGVVLRRLRENVLQTVG